MLKGVLNPRCFEDFAEHDDQEAMYSSDEFRMYVYKIKRCSKTRSHDWTQCPYAHRGEKAQRRDPREVAYAAIACPAFRHGKCRKGDSCELAHGVFEFWLHPDRYRTRACTAGLFCQRKVCFFAHTPAQLRYSESKLYKCRFQYKGRMMINGGDHQALVHRGNGEGCSCEGVSNLLKSLRELKMKEDYEEERQRTKKIGSGLEVSVSPHLDWILELVK